MDEVELNAIRERYNRVMTRTHCAQEESKIIREDVPKLLDEVERLQKENQRLEAQILEDNQLMSNGGGEIERLNGEVRRLREENQKLNQEIGGYAGDVGKLAHEMEVLSGRLKHDAIKICMAGDPDDE